MAHGHRDQFFICLLYTSYTDLFAAGLSGGADSAARRRAWLQGLGLPPRLSKKALVEALNSLYTYEEFLRTLPESEGDA